MPTGPQLQRLKPLFKFDHEHLNRHIVELNRVIQRLTERIESNPLSTGKLSGDLDANSFRVVNHGTADSDDHTITRGDLTGLIQTLTETGVGQETTGGATGFGLGGDPTSQGPGTDDGAGGSGGPPFESHFKQVEVDFGSTPTRFKSITVLDSDVTTTSFILVTQAVVAVTGKSQDESEMDRFAFGVTPGNQQFLLWADSLWGPVVNKFKVYYAVAEGA